MLLAHDVQLAHDLDNIDLKLSSSLCFLANAFVSHSAWCLVPSAEALGLHPGPVAPSLLLCAYLRGPVGLRVSGSDTPQCTCWCLGSMSQLE